MAKVFLALIDGMRPDALKTINHPFYRQLLEESAYSMNMRTVMPSVTLPCHMSLFHGVSADRHGIITNTYVPQVRPVNGICEVLKSAGKSSSLFYTWEPLRDLARPLSLARADFVSGREYTYKTADLVITNRVEEMIAQDMLTDFTFYYQCWADESGHKYGWMTEEYMAAVTDCMDNVQKVAGMLNEDVTFILLADHGGHDRTHGSEMPEDMTIPVFIRAEDIAPGRIDKDLSITDIAPTAVARLGVMPDPDWEGKNIF